MEKIEFQNACYEVLEILKYVKDEDLIKIPKGEINLLKNNANYEHNFEYNPNKNLKEQNVSKLAKGIIALYFSEYTATDEQKEKIRRKRRYDMNVLEKEKREMYTGKNSLNTEIKKEVIEVVNDNQIIEYKEDKWYIKILKFFGLKK